jgi:PAS domain S-box-containing protein
MERSFALANRLLAIANRYSELSPFAQGAAEEIQAFVGCKFVGIRIRNEHSEIPYMGVVGFPDAFVRFENRLSLHVDSCICTRLVLGDVDPRPPVFTPRGSFYLNHATDYWAALAPDAPCRTRNRCVEFGYESIALVPVRIDQETLGLVHLADMRPGMLPLEMVEAIEDVSNPIATAIHRVTAEATLRKMNEALETSYSELEHRVRERTAELSKMNVRLRQAINRHKKTLDILRHSEERFRLAFEEGPLGIGMFRENGSIVKVNRRFTDIVGFAEDELLCMDFSKILVADDRMRFAHALKTVGTGQNTVDTSEFRLLSHDNRRVHVRITTSFLRDVDGSTPCFLGMVEDLTQRKETEEALKRAERLAAIGTLAAGIAHEVNNPVGAIMLSVEAARMARTRPDGEGMIESALNNIHTSAVRCGQIVKNVLQFARAETSRRWPTDLIEVLLHAHELAGKLAIEKGVQLILEPPVRLPPIVMNPTEIEQVLVNVLVNAIQASLPGAAVIISVEATPREARILVADQGCGMTPDQLQRIFNPFFTTRVTEGGVGLGLSASHGIVRQHGGTIEIHSTPNVGTQLTIVIPIVTA